MFRSLRDRTACIIAATAIVLGASPAAAQEYPTRPITFIVAFAPGGFADSVARLLGSKLSERLGQSIIIENRAGGGGNIGAAAVSKAAPDGYTLLVTTTGLAINETLSKSKGFAVDDLAVVTIPAWAPETLSVNPSSPTKNLAGLLQIAKTKPINYASPGVGTSGHIANAYLFQELAKVEAVNVPFQGGALAVNALLGGHVDALAGAVTGYAGQLKVGSIRGIAVAAERRLRELPDIPTYAESGFPEIIASTWVGIFAPARTDAAILQKLNMSVNDVLRDASTQSQLQALQTEFRIGDRADAGDYFRRDVARWQKMIIRIGLAPQ
jgi:tripartite-type tricarboxylate transporter receptor subunit TctC